MNCMPNRLMNPVPMSGNIISRFRWVLVAVAAALLVVPLALHAQLGLAAPGNLTATIGDSEVRLSWDNPFNNAITKYQISTDGGSNFVNILCNDGTATGHTVTGLTNGTAYTFQVRAYDNSGPGAPDTVTATPLFDAPTTLEAWPGDGYLQLRWDEPDDSRISGYEVSIDGGDTYTVAEDQGHESETVGYSVLGLTNGTNYTIAVRVVNGAAATFDTTKTTPVIPALSRLEATPGYGRVTLSWRDREDDRIKKYQFSSDGGANYNTSVESGSSDLVSYKENNLDFLKYTIAGLTNGTSYTLKVRTANADDTVIGAEAPPETMDPLTATPFAAPSNLTAAPGDGQVTLSWDDPETTEISKYQLKIDSGAFTDIPSSGATTTEHTVTGLTNYTSYTFEVRAYDSNGAGPSAAVIAYPVAGPTAAPDNLQATPAGSQVTLTWDDPGNAAITGYEVSSDGGASYSVISGSGATTTSHTVLNLTNFTAYMFTVRAVNASGAGAPSKAVRGEPGVVPGDVVNLTANAKHERVELSWTDPTSHDRTGGYRVRYKKSNDNAWGEWKPLGNPGATTTNELTIYDLTNSESHDFEVLAYNYIGDGPTSELTATPVPEVPTAPANLIATPGDGEVTLTWDDPPVDEKSSTDGYKVSYNGFDSHGSTNKPSYTAPSLVNGTTYSFEVRANNSAGDSLSSEVKEETPLFAAPKGLQASPGGRQVTLTWDDPGNDDISGYEVSSDNGANYTPISGSDADTTEHTVTGLTGGTERTFAVRAVHGVAATVKQTPLFASPADLTVLVGDQQITLNWTNPVNSAISGYELRIDNGANYTPISGSDYTTTEHTLTGLTNGTTYSFAVRAVNCPANGAAAMVEATPLFDAPTGLTATAGYGEVTLNWVDPGNTAITGYQVSSDGWGSYSTISDSDSDSDPTTISHTVTGLTGGTSYTFAVRAVNGAAATVSETPLFAAPAGLTATAGYGEVMLGWDNPGNNNITGYEISIDAGTFVAISDSDYNTIEHTETDLTGGTSYTFAVRAVNASGEGASSDTVSATPLFAAPENLQATAGDGQVMLGWDDPENTNISGYELSIDGGTFEEIDGSNANTTGHTVTGLNNGTSYIFAVRAVNGAAAMVDATPLAVPAKPTTFAAAPGDGEVMLSWDDPSNSSISGYELSIDGETFAEISGSDEDTTGHTVQNLTGGTSYTFAVRAVNASGEGASSDTVSATPLFAAPENLQATVGDGQVMLSWTDPGNSNISGYELNIDSGAFADILGSDAATTSHTVTGLTNGTTYTFAVRATNGAAAMVDATPTPLATLIVSFGASNYEATEGGSDASVTVSLSALAGGDLTIPITTEPTSGDFALSATSLSFAVDDQTKIITVSAAGDADLDDEQVKLGFGPLPEYVGEGSHPTTTVNLKDKGQEETPPPPPPVPGRPGNLTATPDDGAVALSWTAAEDNGSPITNYQHRRSGVEWEDVPGRPTATEVTVSGLTNGVEYVFYVRAVSSAGAGAEASVSATPAAAPDAPGNLTAAPGDRAVALSWAAAANNGSPIIKYQHQRDDTHWADIAGGATTNSLTVTGLVNDTQYTFSVRAVNGMGEGAVASVTAAPQADLADPEPGETPVPTPESTPTPTATPEPTPTPTATPEPTPTPTATPEPTRQVVLPTSTLEPQKAEALATVTPLTAIGPVVVTPTAVRMVGPTPLPTATPTPGLTATVVPRGTLEPTVRPIATPAETPLEEALGRITDSSLVPVGIGLFTVLIVALAALLLASRRRR